MDVMVVEMGWWYRCDGGVIVYRWDSVQVG